MSYLADAYEKERDDARATIAELEKRIGEAESALKQKHAIMEIVVADAAQAYFRKYEPPSEAPPSTTEAENE